MRLSGKWLQPLKFEEKDKFRDLLVNDTVVLNRLYDIISEFEKELDQGEFSVEEYKNPAFPFLKADRIGERRAYRKVKELLSFLKEE